ncbi:Nitrogen permease regulator 2 [Sporothrix eucalyptigena]|uniref:Nitrogen permease regulator 2 n=1 Tax=Sporothrix eucalyptigena TaxID=1812306 RepID=A0ABP0AUD1_9PEZI
MPINGIFYARFLPQEGTKIVAQSPPGCIVPVAVADESDEDFDDRDFDTTNFDGRRDSEALDTVRADSPDGRISPKNGIRAHDSDQDSDQNSDDDNDDDATTTAAAAAAAASALLGGSSIHTHSTHNNHASTTFFPKRARGKPLFDFDVMQEYVIPRPAFFNRYLAAQDPSGKYTVLGLPVAIRDAKYDRNEFIFNFGIVVDADDDQGPYERVVRRLASTFAEMEKQNEFLSREEQRSIIQRGKTTTSTSGGGIGEALNAGNLNVPGSGVPTAYPASPAIASGGHGSGAASTPGGGDTPGFHAMAGVMGNSMAISSIDGFLDRRRIAAAAQSPLLGPQQTQQGAGNGVRTASGGKVGSAVATSNLATSVTAASNTTLAEANGHSPYHRRSIQSLLEIIKEDLNLYGECMIPVDDANTINMKLFPLHPNPPAVEGWHVPVPKMRLAETVDPSWDLTLQRVIAHMDGVSDVRRIAFEADISMELCRSALRHLLYYDTILLLDMFFFGSCYAPRPGIHDFVANVGGIVDECARYVCLGWQQHQDDDDGRPATTTGGTTKRPDSSGKHAQKRNTTTLTTMSDDDTSNDSDDADHVDEQRPLRVSNYDLIRLMTSFCVGRTVTEWLKGHADAGFDVLRYVDVRRLVQFGVIKGCLYRVHKYVVSKQYLASLVTGRSAIHRPSSALRDGHGHHNSHHGHRHGHSHDEHPHPDSDTEKDPLQKYTDGHHNFDQIITEQNLTEVELIERLKRLPLPAGDLKILYR